jgi:hypothetical protein
MVSIAIPHHFPAAIAAFEIFNLSLKYLHTVNINMASV